MKKDAKTFILGEQQIHDEKEGHYDCFNVDRLFPKDNFSSYPVAWNCLIENVSKEYWYKPWGVSRRRGWFKLLAVCTELGIKWTHDTAFNVWGDKMETSVGVYIPEDQMERLREEIRKLKRMDAR